MNTPLIEACVDSYASCKAAYLGGADRLELCAHLVIGGTTPSPALFRQVARDIPVKINVLIRPRFGDFLYSEAEMEQMCEEIQTFRDLGANGVVIGALTLHRAFDMTRDPFRTLEEAVQLGCKTILTSGQQKDALAGVELLEELFRRADGRIDIMAGCGVKKWNIQEIHDRTGIVVFHTTGRKGVIDSGMRYRKQTVAMGLPSLSEYELWQTDEEEFRACAQIVHGLAQGAQA